MCAHVQPHPGQRALLEQKQKKKRQEPLMVQSTVDGRSRTRRTKQSEEQAPLVESYLSSNISTIYNGEQEEREPPDSGISEMRLINRLSYRLPARSGSRKYNTIYCGLFQRAANLRKWFEAGD